MDGVCGETGCSVDIPPSNYLLFCLHSQAKKCTACVICKQQAADSCVQCTHLQYHTFIYVLYCMHRNVRTRMYLKQTLNFLRCKEKLTSVRKKHTFFPANLYLVVCKGKTSFISKQSFVIIRFLRIQLWTPEVSPILQCLCVAVHVIIFLLFILSLSFYFFMPQKLQRMQRNR